MRGPLAAVVALLSATAASAAISSTSTAEVPRPSLAESAENYSTVEAVSGGPLHLNNHGSVTKECGPAPIPTIRVIDRPKHGTLTIRLGTIADGQIGNCKFVDLPIRGVFYVSKPGYVGADRVTYEVIAYDGQIEKFDIAITVTAAAK
jgi:hypothetical protein